MAQVTSVHALHLHADITLSVFHLGGRFQCAFPAGRLRALVRLVQGLAIGSTIAAIVAVAIRGVVAVVAASRRGRGWRGRSTVGVEEVEKDASQPPDAENCTRIQEPFGHMLVHASQGVK